MPKYEHAVQVAEFSKDSLTQLKKAFAPSLESIFEARQKTAETATAKKISGSTGLLAMLLKPFKRLAALLGVAALAVIAFVAALKKNKDTLKDALKNLCWFIGSITKTTKKISYITGSCYCWISWSCDAFW